LNHPIENEPNHAKRTARQELKHEAIEFVKMIVWFLILFGILKTVVIEGYEVQGDCMEPALADRERILVFKLPHNLSKLGPLSYIDAVKEGDIVIFDSVTEPDKRYVKRVVARGPKRRRRNTVEAKRRHGQASPGETVNVQFKNGTVYVNYKRLMEDYLPPGRQYCKETHEEELYPSQYYVLGDNRRVSKDSRSFGAIDDDHIIGKAVFRFWPLSRFGLL